MYRTGRRSAAGIANWVRRDSMNEAAMHYPQHMSDEQYEPIYYPSRPSDQAQQQQEPQRAEDVAQAQPSPYYCDYASSDGYRSLMAFNSQQRSAGKLNRKERSTGEDAFAYRDDHRPHGTGIPLQDRTSPQQIKAYPGASSLGYLLGGV